MLKSDLISILVAKRQLTQKQAEQTIDAIFDSMKDALCKGDEQRDLFPARRQPLAVIIRAAQIANSAGRSPPHPLHDRATEKSG